MKNILLLMVILLSSVSKAADFTINLKDKGASFYLVCERISNSSLTIELPSTTIVNAAFTFAKLPSGYLIRELRANGYMVFYNNAGSATNAQTNPIYRYEAQNCTGTPYIAVAGPSSVIAFSPNISLMRIPATITKNGSRYFKIPESSNPILNMTFQSFLSSDGNCVNSVSSVIPYNFPAEEILETDISLSDVNILRCSHNIK